jgi:hypothetical protein
MPTGEFFFRPACGERAENAEWSLYQELSAGIHGRLNEVGVRSLVESALRYATTAAIAQGSRCSPVADNDVHDEKASNCLLAFCHISYFSPLVWQ